MQEVSELTKGLRYPYRGGPSALGTEISGDDAAKVV